MTKIEVVADCARCAGVCCVALSFEKSSAFAFAKKAGVHCVHLSSSRCTIHAERVARGFAGCAAYDCHGAGQRATALFPDDEAARIDAFIALRRMHEVLWMLDGAARLARDGACKAELDDAFARVARGERVDVDAVMKRVRPSLRILR